MSSDWSKMPFGDFISLQRGHDLPEQERKSGDVPILGSFGVTGWHNKAIAKAPGLTIGRSGASFGTATYTEQDYFPLNTALYVTDFKGNNPKFSYYFAKHFDFSAFNSGSAQPSLNRNFINPVEVSIPPLVEQKAIAHILGTLDDKIELNRKTNETLEGMAKALFKSWFVDFDPVRAKAEGRPTGFPAEISDLFPDSFEDSELGEIPSGWEVGGLEEFLVLQRGFDLPAPQRIKGAYPVVAASGVSGTHNEPMAFAPGVVTGRSGVLGKVFYIQTDFFPLNTTLWAKEFRLATPIYGYFLLCDIDFAVFNAGSAVPTLNRNHLGSLRFPLPPKAVVVSFTDIAIDLMKRKEGIIAETSNLSATRDALLPKLISGEIRIPDAEKMLGEVDI